MGEPRGTGDGGAKLVAAETPIYVSEWHTLRVSSYKEDGICLSDRQRSIRSTRDSPLACTTTAASEPPASPCTRMTSTASPLEPVVFGSEPERAHMTTAQEHPGPQRAALSLYRSTPPPECPKPETTVATATEQLPISLKNEGALIPTEWQSEARVTCPLLTLGDDAQKMFTNELDRSLVQVRRAAEENFAISKAAMYRRMVQEFQADRKLCLDLLKETMAEAEAVRSELGAMRAGKEAAEDRLSRLFAYMCRRILRQEARERTEAAWKAWLRFWECRKARKVLKKLAARLSSERMVRRCFHPWQTASLRATAGRLQQRAVLTAQQEAQRLLEVVEGDRQKQGQLLLEVRRKLQEEAQYRELLQRNIQLILLRGATAICVPQRSDTGEGHVPFPGPLPNRVAMSLAPGLASPRGSALPPGSVTAHSGPPETHEVLEETPSSSGAHTAAYHRSHLGPMVPLLPESSVNLSSEQLAGPSCTRQCTSHVAARRQSKHGRSAAEAHRISDSSTPPAGGDSAHSASGEGPRCRTDRPQNSLFPQNLSSTAPSIVGHSALQIRLPSSMEACNVTSSTYQASVTASRLHHQRARSRRGDFSLFKAAGEKATVDMHPPVSKALRCVMPTSSPIPAQPASTGGEYARRTALQFLGDSSSKRETEVGKTCHLGSYAGPHPTSRRQGRLLYPGGVERVPRFSSTRGAWSAPTRAEKSAEGKTATTERERCRAEGVPGAARRGADLWHKEARWTRSATSTKPHTQPCGSSLTSPL